MAASNGNGVHQAEQPAVTTVLEEKQLSESSVLEEQQQRPRKLSFDDTDMELTRLKQMGATVRKFPLAWIVAAVGAIAAGGLLVRYLLPFESGSLEATLATLSQWRQLAAHRVTVTLAENRHHLDSLRTTVEQQLRNPSLVLLASALGLMVTWFTYYVVYLDSSIPGVNPPTPFSASKQKRFSVKERRFHLGYITALLSGLTVFLILVFVD